MSEGLLGRTMIQAWTQQRPFSGESCQQVLMRTRLNADMRQKYLHLLEEHSHQKVNIYISINNVAASLQHRKLHICSSTEPGLGRCCCGWFLRLNHFLQEFESIKVQLSFRKGAREFGQLFSERGSDYYANCSQNKCGLSVASCTLSSPEGRPAA